MPKTPGSELRDSQLKIRRVGIVAFDGVEIIDLTGPLDVFALTNEGFVLTGRSEEPVYPIEIFAKKPGLVTASCGLQVHAGSVYGELRDDIDTLIIPGAVSVKAVLSDPLLQDWIRAMSTRVRRLVSVCTGAFLLAEAGLLERKFATTHWAYCERFAAAYPRVKVEPDRIFLRDGSILTSGGVTSGIDLALSLVEEDWGVEQALTTAQYMVVFLKRPGGQSQFSGFLIGETTKRPDLRSMLVWIMEHPGEDHRVETLAERMAMSSRNFSRVFHAETGMAPAKFVEKARVDAARHLLATTKDPIETLAVKLGFKDTERMRKAFMRQLKISPSDYRARFSPRIEQVLPTVTERTKMLMKASVNEN
ncbi:MAG: GlxA family transcriptional regulator [Gammaproteobacteria bacterium]